MQSTARWWFDCSQGPAIDILRRPLCFALTTNCHNNFGLWMDLTTGPCNWRMTGSPLSFVSRMMMADRLQLGETEADYRQRLAASWREFVQLEVERLTTENEFTRAICTATAFGNKKPGVEAEHWLDQFLRDRYGERGLVFEAWTTASTQP